MSKAVVATFATLLRQYRESAGMSQEMLAERAGLSVNAISALERGERRRPYPHTIRALSDALALLESERSALLNAASNQQTSTKTQPTILPVVVTTTPQSPSEATIVQLPKQMTSLIGRAQEAEAVVRLLRREDVRLVTLSGPGGVGKTRLSIEVGSLCSTEKIRKESFRDGVIFVPLAPIEYPAMVMPTIAQTIGAQGNAAQPILQTVINHLRDKQVLLIFDNFEHVAAAALELLELLQAVVGLKLLVTSREALHLRGEHEVPVPTLPLPRITSHLPVEDYLRYDAIQLFLQRAQATQPNFTLTPENAAQVAQICVWLDGLPLAIELAATWTRLLSVDEIAVEIESGLDFLAVTQRDLPERHRSIRAVFEHSWLLLSHEEQRTLYRLAVFRGTFERQFAEQVTESSLTLLLALVTKSLLYRTANGRFQLHETTRQFAFQKLLTANEVEPMRDRHLLVYLRFVRTVEPLLYSADQPSALAKLQNEQDNLRAALDWGLHQSTQLASKIAAAQLAAQITHFLNIRGMAIEGLQWAEDAIRWVEPLLADSAHQSEVKPLLAQLFYEAGNLAGTLDDKKRSIDYLERSLAIFRTLDSKRSTVRTLQRLIEISSNTGEPVYVNGLLEESLVLSRATGDQKLLARTLVLKAMILTEAGNHSEAESPAREGLSLYRTLKMYDWMIYTLNILGQVTAYLGNLTEAKQMFEEALSINQIHNPLSVLGMAWSLRNLGLAAQLGGDYAQAESYYQQSLRLRLEAKQPGGIAWSLEGLAEVAALTGDGKRAVRLWAVADRLRKEASSLLSVRDQQRYNERTAEVRLQLGNELFDTLWRSAQRLTAEDVR